MIEYALIGAVAALAGAGIAFATFWLTLGGRIGRAEADAQAALQTAAEAGEAAKEVAKSVTRLTEQLSEMMREFAKSEGELEKKMGDVADAVRRDFGQTVEAIRTKVHEFETWSRDEFVRKKSFEEILARHERLLEQRDDRLDKRLERIERMLDEERQRRGNVT